MTHEQRDNLRQHMSAAPDEESALIILFAALVKSPDLGDHAIAEAKPLNLNRHMVCEAILQSFLFAGFPRCINGLESFRKHFGAEPSPQPAQTSADQVETWRQAGTKLFSKIYGANTEVVLAALDSYHSDLRDWILVDAYGKILSRAGLMAKTRELFAVVGLLVSGDSRQLTSHMRGALHCGAEREDIAQTIELVSFLVPVERTELGRSLVSRI